MELELKKLTKEFQGFKAVDDITLTMSNALLHVVDFLN